MKNNIEINEEGDFNINTNKNKNNNLFINFIEEYYGYFKQFISFKDLYNFGKVNHKLMSLFLIDKGNILLHKKELKIIKLKNILLVSI